MVQCGWSFELKPAVMSVIYGLGPEEKLNVGHDRFLSVYEVSVIIDNKSIVKTRTELTVCVCKPVEDTFKIESAFVICVYLYIVTNIEARRNNSANHRDCSGRWTFLNC